MNVFRMTLGAFAAGLVVSCSTVYYSTLERFGVDKRDILVDRVEEARDQQGETRDQFVSTLDAFKALTGFDGGELEDQYDELKSRHDDAEDDAKAVRERIKSIEKVAEDLFEEWEEEALEINDTGLRRQSRDLLQQTNERYQGMIAAMHRAEAKMGPVLTQFRDQVLFLKHNLNARAVASLDTQLGVINSGVESLIEEMEASIAEADRFIADLD
ncbi:MAG: DUF2959 domain-containing protein [Planctomycetes bacterium]|nr:DUF2959 domain-containing protein [Planctomycetota bacterium]